MIIEKYGRKYKRKTVEIVLAHVATKQASNFSPSGDRIKGSYRIYEFKDIEGFFKDIEESHIAVEMTYDTPLPDPKITITKSELQEVMKETHGNFTINGYEKHLISRLFKEQ